MDEPINPASRTHEETVEDWDYTEAGKVLYRFYDLINDRFFGSKVPTPVLSFKYSRHHFGSYRNDRNESGLRENITFNIRHLTDPLAEVLETLAHEMVHSWQRNFGKPGSGNYHNAECRKKMAQIGIPCDTRGRSLGMRDPFVSFLREQGIEADSRLTLPETASMAARSGTRLKKWHCPCTTIWAVRRVAAQCTNCGTAFVRA